MRRKLVARHAINRLMRLLRATSNPQMQLAIAQVLCNLAVDRSSPRPRPPCNARVGVDLPLRAHIHVRAETAQEVIVSQRAIINIIDLLVESNSRELHTEVVSTLLNASKNGAPPYRTHARTHARTHTQGRERERELLT